jgi:hypothetical protein
MKYSDFSKLFLIPHNLMECLWIYGNRTSKAIIEQYENKTGWNCRKIVKPRTSTVFAVSLRVTGSVRVYKR